MMPLGTLSVQLRILVVSAVHKHLRRKYLRSIRSQSRSSAQTCFQKDLPDIEVREFGVTQTARTWLFQNMECLAVCTMHDFSAAAGYIQRLPRTLVLEFSPTQYLEAFPRKYFPAPRRISKVPYSTHLAISKGRKLLPSEFARSKADLQNGLRP